MFALKATRDNIAKTNARYKLMEITVWNVTATGPKAILVTETLASVTVTLDGSGKGAPTHAHMGFMERTAKSFATADQGHIVIT